MTTPAGFDPDKKIKLFIPPVAEAITDYPLLVNLTKDDRQESVDDDFTGTDGDAPNPLLWDIASDSDTVELSSNSLLITNIHDTGNTSTAISKFKLSGDYDVQVDVVSLSEINVSYIQFFVGDYFSAFAYYSDTRKFAQNIGGFLSANRTNATGKLRLTRVGTTVSSYYKDGTGDWVLFDSDTVTVKDDYVKLTVYTENAGTTVSAVVDNFQVNSGTIVWPDTVTKGSGVTGFDPSVIFDDLAPPVSVDDDFTGTDGDVPDSRLWNVNEDLWGDGRATSTVEIQSNSLTITSPGVADKIGLVRSVFYLTGDFDFQVDFDGSSVDSASHWLSLLYFWLDVDNRVYIGAHETDNVFYSRSGIGGTWDTQQSVARTNVYGGLRVVRNGAIFTSMYKDGSGSWQTLYSNHSCVTGDVKVVILGDFGSSTTGSVNFDNFTLNSGTIVWLENPLRKKIAIVDQATGYQLPVEIENWDHDNKLAQLHTKVPVLSTTEHTILNFYYDSEADDNDFTTPAEASDDFTGSDGDAPRSDLWKVVTGSPSINSNALELSTATDNEKIESTTRVGGDFDVQVDLNLVTAPNTDFWNFTFRLWNETEDSGVSFEECVESSQKKIKFWHYTTSWVEIDSDDVSLTATKFRFVRVGSTITASYWNGLSWTESGISTELGTDDIKVIMKCAKWGSNPTAVGNFDNFTINSADSITGFVGDTGTHQAKNVWPDIYKFVSHQAQDPSGTAPQILDSTQYAKHGTSYGTMTSDDLIDADTGKLIEYDGTDDYTNHGYDPAHDITDVLTIRAVIRPNITLDSNLTDAVGVVGRQHDSVDGQDTYSFVILNDGRLVLGTSGGGIYSTKASWAVGETFTVVGTYNATGTIGDLFVNGVKEVLTLDTIETMAGSTNNLIIGKNQDTLEFFPGSIDEVAIINDVMTDEWVEIDALAIRDNLITFSAEETLPGWDPVKRIKLTIPAPKPESVDDDFTGTNGDAPDVRLWGETIYGSTDTIGEENYSIQNNTLDFALTQYEDYEGVPSKFLVNGDFDVQVDFSMDAAPPQDTSWAFGLTGQPQLSTILGTDYSMIARYNLANGPYRANTDGGTASTGGAADLSGKFRITRSGTTCTMYYWSGADWTTLHTDASYTSSDLYIILFARVWGEDKALNVNFDNFTLNSGTIVWPDHPLVDFPALINLGDASGITNYDTSEVLDELGPDTHTKLLIHSDTTDGSTDFVDSSIYNHTVTPITTVRHESDQAKFGNTSIYCAGGSNDRLDVTNSSDFEFVGVDFTIDFWVYRLTTDADYMFGIAKEGNSSSNYGLDFSGTTELRFHYSYGVSTQFITTSGANLTTATWHHIAVCRLGSTIKLYVNGVAKSTHDMSTKEFQSLGTLPLRIFCNSSASSELNGYIDEFRVSKGIARWTTDFDTELPTAPYEVIFNKRMAVTTEDLTQLPVEIENWEVDNAQLHTKVPSIPATEDTILYLYYDKDHDDNTDYVGDTGDAVAQQVWSDDAKTIALLGQDPSGGASTILDSTSNDNHGTPANLAANQLVDMVSPLSGKGIDFVGDATEQITFPGSSLDLAQKTVTVTVDLDAQTGTASWSHIFSKESKFFLSTDPGNSRWIVGQDFTTADGRWSFPEPDLSPHVVSVVYDRSSVDNNPIVFVDGVKQVVTEYSTPVGTAVVDNTDDLYLGNHVTDDRDVDGKLGAVFYYSGILSDEWLMTTNESMSDSLITFSEAFIEYDVFPTNLFLLGYGNSPFFNTRFLEHYHISAIPKAVPEKYALVEEKDIAIPEGYNNRIRLKVGKDKISSTQNGFMALVQLDQQHLFDTVKKPRPYPRFNNSASKYISTTGSDEHGNGTLEAPYKSMYKAVTSGTGSTYCVFLPGTYYEDQYVDSVDRNLYIESSTGDYRDVIIVTSSSLTRWWINGDGNYSYIRNVTIEDYTISDCFYMNSGRTYMEHVFYSYKGDNTSHYLCGGSQVSHGSVYAVNCVFDYGVQTYAMYYTGVALCDNVICNIEPVNYFGPHADPTNCCYPSPMAGYNNIDRDVYPPDFTTGAEIPFTSPCCNAGRSTNQSYYEGAAPDIGCHEVGDPHSRLLFTDKHGNGLNVEIVEWDDVNNTGTFYVGVSMDSTEDTDLYLHYAETKAEVTSDLYDSSVPPISLMDVVFTNNNTSMKNNRVKIPSSMISSSGPGVIIHFGRIFTTNYYIVGCYVGHRADGTTWGFDGSQVQVTYGGNTSFTINTPEQEMDFAELVIDPSKDLIISFFFSSGNPPVSDSNDSGITTYSRGNSVDESYLNNPSSYITYSNMSVGIDKVIIPPYLETFWSNYSSVIHGRLLPTSYLFDSAQSSVDITTSPAFDDTYYISTPYGPGLNFAQSSAAHAITSDVFSITAGTIVAVFNTDNTTSTQVLFATPASASTNQHTFELTTAGAIQITDAGGTTSVSTENGFNDGGYHTVVFNWSATGRIVEVDKTPLTLSNPTATFATAPSSAEGLIGYDYVSKNAASNSFDGIIGEFRVSKTALNGDLIETIGYSETDTLFDSTMSIKSDMEEEYGAGTIDTFRVLSWIIAKGIPEYSDVTVYEEPWVIMQPPNLQVFEEFWGLKLLNTITEVYGDIALKKGIFVEWYDDGVNPKNTFIEKYQDAERRKAVYSLLWLIHTNPQAFINEEYSITEFTVLNVLEELYELKERNKAITTKELPYYLLAEDSVLNKPTAEVLVNGTMISTTGVSVEAGMDQYCISCTINPASAEDYARCQYLDDAEITVGGTTFIMFVESVSRRVTNSGTTYTVELLSPTAKLDSPYADTILDSLDEGVFVETLVTQMAAVEGITVDYQIINWFIPGYAISINDETPLEVIRKVVNAVGGIVQTKPNGDMLIISKYPVSPPEWANSIPVATFSIESDIRSLYEVISVRDGYNAFIITDQGSSSESIRLEEENVNETTKIVKGFRVPFDDGSFPLETSGGENVIIDAHTVPITEAVPLIENEGDSEWEVIEFIDHTGSTSYPIYGIIDVEWITDDLGAITISEDGTLTVTNPESVPSESLLRIKYYTKYWKFTVTGPDTHPVQVYVPEIEE